MVEKKYIIDIIATIIIESSRAVFSFKTDVFYCMVKREELFRNIVKDH